jgi:hypothetical protein
MDVSSLARLKELKSQAVKENTEESQPMLDPSIFFTQVTGTKAEESISVEDDLFATKLVETNSDSSMLSEDDLFGEVSKIEINQSFNLEAEVKAETDMIHALEDQLKNTTLIDPKAASKIQTEEETSGYVNGSSTLVISDADKPAKVLKVKRKAIKKSDHSDNELTGVDAYEILLIKLFLQKIKK